MSLDTELLASAGMSISQDTPLEQNIAIRVFGPPGSGKSRFGLTAPGPLFHALYGVKNELDSLIQEFEQEKQIVLRRYVDAGEKASDDDDTDLKKFFGAQNERFEKEARLAMRAGVRTGVYDKNTDVWEAVRYAMFGAAATLNDYQRAKANREYARLIRMWPENERNLVIIDEDDAEWVDGPPDENGKIKRVPSGRRIPKGNERVGYLVDVTLRAFREGKKFFMEVTEAKKRPDLNGMILEGPTFTEVAMLVKPEVDWSE